MENNSDDRPDYTMLSRRWRGDTLITSDIALEIARRVHVNVYGQEDLSANEPLSATETGNNWIVRGSKPIRPVRPDQPLDGPLVMKISKFDGQILTYMFAISFESNR